MKCLFYFLNNTYKNSIKIFLKHTLNENLQFKLCAEFSLGSSVLTKVGFCISINLKNQY